MELSPELLWKVFELGCFLFVAGGSWALARRNSIEAKDEASEAKKASKSIGGKLDELKEKTHQKDLKAREEFGGLVAELKAINTELRRLQDGLQKAREEFQIHDMRTEERITKAGDELSERINRVEHRIDSFLRKGA